MKRLVKVLLLFAAVLGVTLAPRGAYGQVCGPPISTCSGGTCVVCFPVMLPTGRCGYICEIIS